ncbi:hypothetical protein RFI_22910, partial [Reticulomyxa filosa]
EISAAEELQKKSETLANKTESLLSTYVIGPYVEMSENVLDKTEMELQKILDEMGNTTDLCSELFPSERRASIRGSVMTTNNPNLKKNIVYQIHTTVKAVEHTLKRLKDRELASEEQQKTALNRKDQEISNLQRENAELQLFHSNALEEKDARIRQLENELNELRMQKANQDVKPRVSVDENIQKKVDYLTKLGTNQEFVETPRIIGIPKEIDMFFCDKVCIVFSFVFQHEQTQTDWRNGTGTTRTFWRKALRVGSQLDGLDDCLLWWTAHVVEVRANQLKIRYDGFDASYDDWVDRGSARLAPYMTKASGGKQQHNMEVEARSRHIAPDSLLCLKTGNAILQRITDKRPQGHFSILDMKETRRLQYNDTTTTASKKSGLPDNPVLTSVGSNGAHAVGNSNASKGSNNSNMSNNGGNGANNGEVHGFEIVTPHRIWRFRCESDQIATEWIGTIHALCKGVETGKIKILSFFFFKKKKRFKKWSHVCPITTLFFFFLLFVICYKPSAGSTATTTATGTATATATANSISFSMSSSKSNLSKTKGSLLADSSSANLKNEFSALSIQLETSNHPPLTRADFNGVIRVGDIQGGDDMDMEDKKEADNLSEDERETSVEDEKMTMQTDIPLKDRNDEEIVYSGWMQKQGLVNTNWNLRWFELVKKVQSSSSNGKEAKENESANGQENEDKKKSDKEVLLWLRWRETIDAIKGKGHGKINTNVRHINLKHVKMVQDFQYTPESRQRTEIPTKFGFELVTPQRTYLFACTSKRDRTNWVKRIRHILNLSGNEKRVEQQRSTARKIQDLMMQTGKDLGRKLKLYPEWAPVYDVVRPDEVDVQMVEEGPPVANRQINRQMSAGNLDLRSAGQNSTSSNKAGGIFQRTASSNFAWSKNANNKSGQIFKIMQRPKSHTEIAREIGTFFVLFFLLFFANYIHIFKSTLSGKKYQKIQQLKLVKQ